MWKTWLKVLAFPAITITAALFVCNFYSLAGFYDDNHKFFDFLVQISVVAAAIAAARANFRMLNANMLMVDTAKKEIEMLKHQHNYEILPVIEIVFPDAKYNLKKPLGINNLTNNLALKATVFAKLSNKYYISQKIFTIKSQEHTLVRLQDENFLIEKFEMIYTQELLANPAFKDYFINSILNGDNKFYVVYVDIEGNVHGTSLACEYWTIMDGKVQILPPPPEKFESMRMDIPYCAGEQSFLIGESAIQHGTGIAIASLRRLSE